MRGTTKRIIASACAVTTIASLAACGQTQQSGQPNEITIFTQAATYEGKLDGWTGKMIKDETGMNVSVVPSTIGGTDRFQTKLTTGELNDLALFTSRDALKQAIDAGAVIDLSKKKDELPNVFRFSDAVKRMTDADNGKVYGMPVGVDSKAELSKTDPVYIPSLRYDYYKELGSPEIKDYWAYKDVAEAMAKAHPKTEAGDNFYALSLFSQWDGTSASQIRSMGYAQGWINTDGINKYEFINLNPKDKTTEELLQDDSSYMNGLEWANSIYRDGMLDPDSVTQTWEDYLKKAEKGQSAMWVFGYMGNLNFNPEHKDLTSANKGYERIPNNELNVVETVSTIGNKDGWYWAIPTKTANLEGSLKFLDYMYSDEGAWKLFNGPEGMFWKMGDDNVPEITELATEPATAEVPAEFGGGKGNETFKNRVNGMALNSDSTNDKYGVPENQQVWKSYLEGNATNLDKQWQADYGNALNAKQMMVDNGMVTPLEVKNVPVLEWNDQDKVIVKQIGDVIKQYSWKMIYANSEDEFKQLADEMVSKAKNLGYDSIVSKEKEYVQNYFDA